MIHFFKILLILFLISQNSYGQINPYKTVDSYVDSLKVPDNISIEELTLKLIKPFKHEQDKVRALFYWVAKNIRYDYKGSESNYWKFYGSEEKLICDTYKLKMGVCSGYSHLLKKMLGLSNIKSEVIDGYARIDLEDIFLNETEEPNHAWNAVEVNGKWELLDATWARDTLNNAVQNFWYFSDPQKFIFSHFPQDDTWTLTDAPISTEVFFSLPVYSEEFFRLGLDKGNNLMSFVKCKGGIASISLNPPLDGLILLKLYKVDELKWYTPKYSNEKNILQIKIPEKGKYIASISILIQNDSKATIHKNVVLYGIENK